MLLVVAFNLPPPRKQTKNTSHHESIFLESPRTHPSHFENGFTVCKACPYPSPTTILTLPHFLLKKAKRSVRGGVGLINFSILRWLLMVNSTLFYESQYNLIAFVLFLPQQCQILSESS